MMRTFRISSGYNCTGNQLQHFKFVRKKYLLKEFSYFTVTFVSLKVIFVSKEF